MCTRLRRLFFAPMALLALVMAPVVQAAPLKVVLVSGSALYHSDEALTQFQRWLETHYEVEVTLLKATSKSDLPGLEALEQCDTALFYTRRLEIDGEQLERVKRYLGGGKPFVAVRTTSHGFQNYLELDKDVLGGNYKNHLEEGPTMEAEVVAGGYDHPILQGVGTIRSRCSVYRTGPLAPDTQALLHVKTKEDDQVIPWMRGTDKKGRSIREDADHPVAWTREHAGGRLFYTALGSVSDFENASFQMLVANALFWTARREPAGRALPEPVEQKRTDMVVELPVRTQVERGGQWVENPGTQSLPTTKTALLVCDVRDHHWCATAAERIDALVPQIDATVRAARAAGMLIIHAPSDTMDFYIDTPGRRRAQAAPPAPQPRAGRVPQEEAPLPVEGDDAACDVAALLPYAAWTRQHPGIGIEDVDAISDDGQEIYNLLAQQGIEHLVVLGVHANAGVLSNTYGIRQMTRQGVRCYLVRDLTDTLYDTGKTPDVPQDQGTALVVRHIERFWAPSLLSTDFISALSGR